MAASSLFIKEWSNILIFSQDAFAEAVVCSCSSKLLFLKNFANFTGKHLLQSLFNKVGSLKTPTQVIFCYICKVFKSTFFPENFQWLLCLGPDPNFAWNLSELIRILSVPVFIHSLNLRWFVSENPTTSVSVTLWHLDIEYSMCYLTRFYLFQPIMVDKIKVFVINMLLLYYRNAFIVVLAKSCR